MSLSEEQLSKGWKAIYDALTAFAAAAELETALVKAPKGWSPDKERMRRLWQEYWNEHCYAMRRAAEQFGYNPKPGGSASHPSNSGVA